MIPRSSLTRHSPRLIIMSKTNILTATHRDMTMKERKATNKENSIQTRDLRHLDLH